MGILFHENVSNISKLFDTSKTRLSLYMSLNQMGTIVKRENISPHCLRYIKTKTCLNCQHLVSCFLSICRLSFHFVIVLSVALRLEAKTVGKLKVMFWLSILLLC